MNTKEKNNRRNFLRSILTVAAALRLLPSAKTTLNQNKEKIKMLTADGKLVEVDKSALDAKADIKRASNAEVLNWMNSKHKA
jgi:hypothetical protein